MRRNGEAMRAVLGRRRAPARLVERAVEARAAQAGAEVSKYAAKKQEESDALEKFVDAWKFDSRETGTSKRLQLLMARKEAVDDEKTAIMQAWRKVFQAGCWFWFNDITGESTVEMPNTSVERAVTAKEIFQKHAREQAEPRSGSRYHLARHGCQGDRRASFPGPYVLNQRAPSPGERAPAAPRRSSSHVWTGAKVTAAPLPTSLPSSQLPGAPRARRERVASPIGGRLRPGPSDDPGGGARRERHRLA